MRMGNKNNKPCLRKESSMQLTLDWNKIDKYSPNQIASELAFF